MSRVALSHLSKRFSRAAAPAVDDVSFDVADGEFLAILGPSGCGKTTTMRMIAGLEYPDSGDIFLGERRVNSLNAAQRNTAMAFENYGLYPHWNCFDNIGYPLRLRHVVSGEINQRVNEVARMLNIEDVLDKKPAEISGGSQQRVGLARALVREPEVFLLDEPMSHVDPYLRSQMRAELKRIQRDSGATMIYVTHDQLEAMAMADRILVMQSGRIQQLDTPYNVFNHPVNEFVAGFVGEPPANFLPARVERQASQIVLGLESGERIPAPRHYCPALDAGKYSHITLGIRSHTISVVPADAPEKSVSAVVYVVEPLGDHNIVTVKVGDGIVKIETGPDFQCEADRLVGLTFDSDGLLLFNTETGRVLERSTPTPEAMHA